MLDKLLGKKIPFLDNGKMVLIGLSGMNQDDFNDCHDVLRLLIIFIIPLS